MADFDANITLKISNAITEADFDLSVLIPVHDVYKTHTIYNGEGTPNLNPIEQVPAVPPEEIIPTPEIWDSVLEASVLLPHGGTHTMGTSN